MKELIAPLMIICFLIYGTKSFIDKIATIQDQVDEMKVAVADVKEIVPAGAAISFHVYGDTTNTATFYLWARYALAPHYLSPDPNECDTVLSVFPVLRPGVDFSTLIKRRKVLWKKEYSSCGFLLTSRH